MPWHRTRGNDAPSCAPDRCTDAQSVDDAGEPFELHLVMDNYAAHKHPWG